MPGRPTVSDTGPQDARFYRAILEHSQDLVTVVDPEGRPTYSSPALRRLVGYDPEELAGVPLFELIHPEDRPIAREALAELLEETDTVVRREVRFRHRDGSVRVVEGIAKNLVDRPPIDGVLVTLRDVTALRRAQADLGRTQQLLRQVVSHAPIVVWMIDAEGTFHLSEGRGLGAMGLEPGEVVGKSIYDVYAADPDGLDLVRQALAGEVVETMVEAAGRHFTAHVQPIREAGEVVGVAGVALDITDRVEEAERARFRARLLDQVGQAVIATDPEGSIIYWNPAAEELYGWSRSEAMGGSVEELTVPEPTRDSASEIMEALRRGERWTGEYVVRRKDGTEFPALVTNVPVVEEGELVAVIGVSADLTERKQLENELRRAQKMEAVGQLAGGIAHDFNNLLTTIGGYATLAGDRTDDPQVTADLKEIEEATRRARGLADKLLAFSRRRTARIEALDLNGSVRAMVSMITRLLGGSIRLELDLTDQPWRVEADPSLTEQAILNLVLNARDAMPEGGTVTISSHRVGLDPARAAELDAELAPGEYMRLVVADTGVGMARDVQERIFDPFFTTKEVGQGSGLGLSMVYGAVKQVGGAVTVESEPGAGTRVAVFLPRAETEDQTALDLEEPETASEEVRVLVVEDEPAVLSLARRVLDREGYEVLVARSGEEARRLIEEEDARPNLVVTDVIMPEMSGPELIQRLRLQRPAIRSLFMSGYAADELQARGLDREQEAFLAKPFTPADLAAAVRRALGH